MARSPGGGMGGGMYPPNWLTGDENGRYMAHAFWLGGDCEEKALRCFPGSTSVYGVNPRERCPRGTGQAGQAVLGQTVRRPVSEEEDAGVLVLLGICASGSRGALSRLTHL